MTDQDAESVGGDAQAADWRLRDTAYLSRKDNSGSIEFVGYTDDMLGEETSGCYAVFEDDGRILLVDQEEVDP